MQLKLVSVRPFSYSVWKLIDDLSTEKSLKVQDLSREQLAAVSFAILPDSAGNRIRKAMKKFQHDKHVAEQL